MLHGFCACSLLIIVPLTTKMRAFMLWSCLEVIRGKGPAILHPGYTCHIRANTATVGGLKHSHPLSSCSSASGIPMKPTAHCVSPQALGAEIVVAVDATTEHGDQFMTTRSYLPSEMHWGCTFVNVISRAKAPSTHHSIDIGRWVACCTPGELESCGIVWEEESRVRLCVGGGGVGSGENGGVCWWMGVCACVCAWGGRGTGLFLVRMRAFAFVRECVSSQDYWSWP